MKKVIYIFSSLFLSVLAIPVMAAVADFKTLVNDILINGILKPIVPFLIGIAVVLFVYGVVTLIFSEGGDKREEGKKFMMWGIIGLAVMLSVWGLVAILQGTFNLNNTTQQIKIQKLQTINID